MSKYGLLGRNINKSLSKEIHELLAKHEYDLVQVEDERDVLSYLKTNFKMINITNPYKSLAYENCSEFGDVARDTKVVNTIIKKYGNFYGFNTDVYGFGKLLEKNRINVVGKKCLIFGTGSTSKSVAFLMEKFGADSIKFLSRNPKENNQYRYDEFEQFKNSEIIVNATPVGAFSNGDDEPLLPNVDTLEKAEVYIDLNYMPECTNQAWLFRRKGIKTISGLEMLFYQAVQSEEIAKESGFEEENLNKILLKIKAKHRNIVLIGHPLAGKSTIGKTLAKKLQMEYYDVDQMIESQGSTIYEIFNEKGEKYFRKLEAKTIKELSSKKGAVISVGGGAVLNEDNMRNLKLNSIIINVKRDIDILKKNDIKNRPLLKSMEDFKSLLNSREKLYEKYADKTVVNNTVKETVERIINSL